MFGKKQTTHIGFNPFSKEKKQKPGVTTKIIDKISQWFRGKLNPSSCIQREIVQQATILVPINYEIVGAQTIEQDSVQIYKSQSSQQQKRNKFTTFNDYLQEEEQQAKVPLKQQLKEQKLQRKEKEFAYDNMLPEDLNLPKGQKNNDRKERQKARRVNQQLFKKRKLNGEKQMQIAIKYKERLSVIDQIQDSINESRIQVVQESDDSLKNNSLLVDFRETKKEKEEIILANQKEGKDQENQPPILQIDQIVESHQKGMKKSQSMINIMNEDGKSLSCSPKKIEPSRKQSLKNDEKPEEKKPEQQEQQQTKLEEQKQIEQPKQLIDFIVTGTEQDKSVLNNVPERANVSDTPLFGFGKNVDSSQAQPRVINVGASLFPSVQKKEQHQQQSTDSGQNLQANLFTFCQTKPKIDNSESLNQPLASDSSSSAPANQQTQNSEVKPLFSFFNKNDSLQIKQGTQSLFANLLESKKEQQQGEQGISQNQQNQQTVNPIEKKSEEIKNTEVKQSSLFGDILKKDSLFAGLKQEKQEESVKIVQPSINEQKQSSNIQHQEQPKTSEEENKTDKNKQQTTSIFNTLLPNLKEGHLFKTEKPSLFSGFSEQNQQKLEENKPTSLFGNLLQPFQVQQTNKNTEQTEQPKLFANIINNNDKKDQQNEVQQEESNKKQIVPPLFNLNQAPLNNSKPTLDTPKSTENQKESESKQELKTPTLNQIGLNCQWKSSDDQKQNSSQINKVEEKNVPKIAQKEEQKSSPFGFLLNKQNNEMVQQSSDFSQKQQIQTPSKPIDNPFLQQSPKIDQEQIKSYFSQQSSSSQAIVQKPFSTSSFADASLFQPQINVPSMFTLPPQQPTQIQASLFQTNPNSSMFFQHSQPLNQFNQNQPPQQQNSFQQFGSVQNNNGMSNEMEIVEAPQIQQNFQQSLFSSAFQQPQQQQSMNSYNQQASASFQMQPQQSTQQLFGNSQQLFPFAQNNNDVMAQSQQNQSLFSLDAQKPGFQSGSLNSSFTSKQGKKKQRITEN